MKKNLAQLGLTTHILTDSGYPKIRFQVFDPSVSNSSNII